MKIHLSKSYSFHQLGQRPNQEDARYPDSDTIDKTQQFFVVCDGVGGSEKGEVASATVCASISDFLSRVNLADVYFDKSMLSKVVDAAYDALDKASKKINGDMGTTMTFICFHKGGCTMAHIGDSRIYQIRPSVGIVYRSEDHSLVNTMVHNGAITPEQAINHPQSNVITRCMEPTDEDESRSMATVINTKDIEAGDYFLLCTDGVLHKVSDNKLAEVICSDKGAKDKIETLSKLSASSSDNNTAILINVDSVESDVEDDNNILSTGVKNTQKFPRGRYSSSELASESKHEKGFFNWIKNKLLKL